MASCRFRKIICFFISIYVLTLIKVTRYNNFSLYGDDDDSSSSIKGQHEELFYQKHIGDRRSSLPTIISKEDGVPLQTQTHNRHSNSIVAQSRLISNSTENTYQSSSKDKLTTSNIRHDLNNRQKAVTANTPNNKQYISGEDITQHKSTTTSFSTTTAMDNNNNNNDDDDDDDKARNDERIRVKLQTKMEQREAIRKKTQNNNNNKNSAVDNDNIDNGWMIANKNSFNDSLWNLSDYIPAWLKRYSEWHTNQRSKLSPWKILYHHSHSSKNENKTKDNNENSSSSSSSSLPATEGHPKVMVISFCACCDVYDNEKYQTVTTKTTTTTTSSSLSTVATTDCLERLVAPLTMIPQLLHEAYRRDRILFLNLTLLPGIYLNEYLSPPIGGIDWRTPYWLNDIIDQSSSIDTTVRNIELKDLFGREDECQSSFDNDIDEDEKVPFLLNVVDPSWSWKEYIRTNVNDTKRTIEGSCKGKHHDSNSISSYSEFHWGESTYEIFHDVWRLLFTPTDVIHKSIFNALKAMKAANPPNYVSINIRRARNRNSNNELSAKSTRAVTKDALDCAINMFPQDQVVFDAVTSKQQSVADHIIKQRNLKNIFVRSSEDNSNNDNEKGKAQPKQSGHLHEWRGQDFYRDFADLYVLGGISTCVMYEGEGSIGYLSALMSQDVHCRVDLNAPTGCHSSSSSSSPAANVDLGQTMEKPTRSVTRKRGQQQGTLWLERAMVQDGSDFSLLSRDNPSTPQAKIPQWLNSYFDWHKRTKESLSESNWNRTKYIMLVCFADQSCGGLSDRIKPLPSILLLAKRYNRLLLIHWERPGPLEDWLVPPVVSGIDWTVPSWLLTILKADFFEIRNRYLARTLDQTDILLKGGGRRFVFSRIQSPTGGESYYNDQADAESTYRDVFHEIFRRFFDPVPRITQLMESKMKENDMIPGQYVSVHLRAMYGNREHRDAQEMINLSVLGVNCASNLLPGRPIYFASDTGSAVEAAKEYARMHSLPVTSLEFDTDPLHLDKDDDWKSRSPSEYDPTFIDLLMLAQSRCVAYSNGGYGTFGSLLSHESDCNVRFFATRRPAKKCGWLSANRTIHYLSIPQAGNSGNTTGSKS